MDLGLRRFLQHGLNEPVVGSSVRPVALVRCHPTPARTPTGGTAHDIVMDDALDDGEEAATIEAGLEDVELVRSTDPLPSPVL